MAFKKNPLTVGTKVGVDGRTDEATISRIILRAPTIFGAHDNAGIVRISGFGANRKEWVFQTGKQISVTPVSKIGTITFIRPFPRALHSVTFSADTVLFSVFAGYSPTQFQVERHIGPPNGVFVIDYTAWGY